MLRCSLSYAKITQTECIMKKNVFISYAEVQLILCKDNAYFSKRCILYGLCNDFIYNNKNRDS